VVDQVAETTEHQQATGIVGQWWDGLRGIVTWGCQDSDPRDVIIQYRQLAVIEACFRTHMHDVIM